MNTALYIAKRMLENKGVTQNRSKPIVFLAIAGITLGISVMILSISIASGFQKEVREKIVGFGSHIQISSSYNNVSFESSPLLVSEIDTAEIRNDKQVKSVQVFAYKPAIIQSKNKREKDGKIIRDIQGVVFKGIGADFNSSFFSTHLIEGEVPKYSEDLVSDSILVSKVIADKLNVKTGEKVAVFFIKETGPQQRNFIVSGIYETGLEDFDKQFCFVDINQIRRLNNWGISAHLRVNENCEYNYVVLEALARGGNKNYRYQWGNKKFSAENKQILCPIKDTVIRVVVSDFEAMGYLEPLEMQSMPDTAWLMIKVSGDENIKCNCRTKEESLQVVYINDSTTQFTKDGVTFTTILRTSGGSSNQYSGGIEVLLNEFEQLGNGEEVIENYISPIYNVTTIVQQNEEIFNWLNMLDMNVYIILGLMILVAIVNMTSALLVLILEKTRTIGILKALGADDWMVQKIFIYNGAFLILKGIIYGNLLAFAIILLQNEFHFLTLPQENYYVSVVPMYFPVLSIIVVNVLAFIVCYLALILPSYIITKITPVKAIKFE